MTSEKTSSYSFKISPINIGAGSLCQRNGNLFLPPTNSNPSTSPSVFCPPAPPPPLEDRIRDHGRQKVLEKGDEVLVSDPAHPEKDHFEKAKDYFKAGFSNEESPESRYHKMFGIGLGEKRVGSFRVSDEFRTYVKREQAKWLRSQPKESACKFGEQGALVKCTYPSFTIQVGGGAIIGGTFGGVSPVRPGEKP